MTNSDTSYEESFLILYLWELDFLCGCAVAAFEEMTQHLRGNSDMAALAYAHILLVYAGNISKFLFPEVIGNRKYAAVEKVSKWRGERLRKILNIARGTLLNDRTFRDYLEHLDTRYDQYVFGHVPFDPKGPHVRTIVPWKVGTKRAPRRLTLKSHPKGAVFRAGTSTEARFFRYLDRSTLILTIFDRKSVDLKKVLKNVQDLRQNVQQAFDNVVKAKSEQQAGGLRRVGKLDSA